MPDSGGSPLPDVDLTRVRWRKSTRSSGQGDCVEMAELGDQVAIRHSRQPDGPMLIVSREQWRDLIDRIKHDEL